MATRRTNQQILAQTNELARQFYSLLGCDVPHGYRFDIERKNTHPQERLCWRMACVAQLELTDTDVDEVLSDMEE